MIPHTAFVDALDAVEQLDAQVESKPMTAAEIVREALS